MKCRSEPRTGRHCLWDQMADLGLLVSRSRLTQIVRPIWKVQSQSIESKDIKWCHLVLVRVPPLNLSVMYPWINSWHFDSCGRRKNNLVRAFPEGFECWRRNETPTLQSGLNLCILTPCFLQLLYFISFAEQSTGQVAKHYDLATIQCAGAGRE